MPSLVVRLIAASKRVRLDLFTVLIFIAAILASLAPARGAAADMLANGTSIAIAILFFLHGGRLSREAIVGGLAHWRFHLAALALTFGVFPLLGVMTQLLGGFLSGPLIAGFVYLSVLPSTVQSSIAYTALARGNVPAAVCSASLSNVAGVFFTPLFVSLLIGAQGAGATLAGIQAVVTQILVPFVAGHLSRPLVGALLDRHKAMLSWFDRGVILAIVYRAFGAAVVNDLWSQLSGADFAALAAVVAVFLAAAVGAALGAARLMKFDHPDTVALVFCGMQKSLASGAPMAGILFAPSALGAILLPLMLYHQAQLMLGAFLAQKFLHASDAARPKSVATAP